MKSRLTHRLFLVFIGLPAVLFLFALIECSAGKTKQVKIGMLATLSDNDPPTSFQMSRAAEIAMEEIRSEGMKNRTHGKVEIELIIEDDFGTPESSVEAARKLIYQDEVDAFVGPQFSSSAIPVANLAESAHVIMIAPMSTSPKTTEEKSFVFRIPFTDLLQAEVMAGFAYEELEFSDICVLYNISDAYSSGLANQFKESFTALGGKIPAFVHFTSNTNRDFTEQLLEIRENEPEALYLPNYNEDVMLQAAQAREMGIDAVMLGGDGWSDFKLAKSDAFEGSYLTRHWHPDAANDKAVQVSETYHAAYGEKPDDVFINTYDAFSLLFRCIAEAEELNPEGLRDTLAEMEYFEGAGGSFYYGSSGDPLKQVVIVKIEDKTAGLYKTIQPQRR